VARDDRRQNLSQRRLADSPQLVADLREASGPDECFHGPERDGAQSPWRLLDRPFS
jgi:hypothetical protein